ncbi:MAG: hypothetical protein IPF82_19365 [Blastocatellia bacterium]|nr:hypothetical protein [Blastocatellia bacterium]
MASRSLGAAMLVAEAPLMHLRHMQSPRVDATIPTRGPSCSVAVAAVLIAVMDIQADRPAATPVAIPVATRAVIRAGIQQGAQLAIPAHTRGGYGYPGDQRVGFSTMMVVELETPVSTKYSREGDRFSARVVDPGQYAGSRVEGYIGRIDKAGRVHGKAEIVLVFEGIIFPDGYAERMPAQVEEVLGYGYGYGGYGGYGGRNGQNKRDDINATAGDEGQIVGESSRGRDTAIITGGAGVGAATGAVLGGAKGAVIGAAIGAVTGGTVVALNRGRDIEMQPGAQLRIRTGQGVRP